MYKYSVSVPVDGSVNGMRYFCFSSLFCSCLISECETLETTTFEPDWLQDAVPYEKGKPLHCERYAINSTSHGSLWRSECTKDDFDSSNILHCNKFKYQTDEISVLNEVPLPPPFSQYWIPKNFAIQKQVFYFFFSFFFSSFDFIWNLVWFRMQGKCLALINDWYSE